MGWRRCGTAATIESRTDRQKALEAIADDAALSARARAAASYRLGRGRAAAGTVDRGGGAAYRAGTRGQRADGGCAASVGEESAGGAAEGRDRAAAAGA